MGKKNRVRMEKRFGGNCIMEIMKHDIEGQKLFRNLAANPNNFKILFAFGGKRCKCHS